MGFLANARAKTSSRSGEKSEPRLGTGLEAWGNGDGGGARATERAAAGYGLERQHGERILVGSLIGLGHRLPLLGRHVRRRPERRTDPGDRQAFVFSALEGGNISSGLGDLSELLYGLEALCLLFAQFDRHSAVVLGAALGQISGSWQRSRDAEVEQLGQELARTGYHHHVGWLDVAMDDALLMRAVNHLAELFEQRHEPRQRNGPLGLDHLFERSTPHEFHGQPQKSIGLGAKCIYVSRVGMIEPRRQLRLTEEALSFCHRWPPHLSSAGP